MSTVNRVFLIGYLGSDPEMRALPNGDAVANFSIATTQRWKDKGSGEDREETEWSKIVFYRKQAEIAGQYLKKGAHVCVQGRMRTRKWADKNGVDRYTTEIVGTDLQMLGRAQRDPDTSEAEDRGAPKRPSKSAKAKSVAQTFEDLDSDVSF